MLHAESYIMSKRKIAVILTCHNRKDKTLACLDAIANSSISDTVAINIYLADDGSTDGTGQLVSQMHPNVKLIEGDGSLYWNRGMHLAFSHALQSDYSFYLWINDDTLLFPKAILELINTADKLSSDHKCSCIVVGSTKSTLSGKLTYGGVIRPKRWKRTTFVLVEPSDEPQECETMNGNCVLIPAEIARNVGNLDPRFEHAMGDQDYGLRARASGYRVWIAPRFVGVCEKNSPSGTFNDGGLSLPVRIRKMLHPKGLPIQSWKIFTQRHAGVLWPIFWAWPYLKIVGRSVLKR